jgi:hypothetical protein
LRKRDPASHPVRLWHRHRAIRAEQKIVLVEARGVDQAAKGVKLRMSLA